MRKVLGYVVPKYDGDRLSIRPSTCGNVQYQRYACEPGFCVKTVRSRSSDRRFLFCNLQRLRRDVVSPRAKFHADRLGIRLRPRPLNARCRPQDSLQIDRSCDFSFQRRLNVKRIRRGERARRGLSFDISFVEIEAVGAEKTRSEVH